MNRKQRAKEKLGFQFPLCKVPSGYFTKAEWAEYYRRNDQHFIDKFSNAMQETYGARVKKQHRQQRKRLNGEV